MFSSIIGYKRQKIRQFETFNKLDESFSIKVNTVPFNVF
jgi:hypothetical protein